MNSSFDWWCRTAVDQILFKPDREEVYRELYAHLEDLYDAATDRGLSPAEASAEALKLMGSASEIAPQLGAIHRPLLGYLLNVTRWIVYAAYALLVLQLIAFFHYNSLSQSRVPWYYENPGEELVVHSEDGIWESSRLMDYDPNVRDFSDGFTFDVARAVMTFHDNHTDDSQNTYYFWFQIDVSGLMQWAQLDDIPVHDFWAVDSLGNTYCSYKNDALSTQRSVSGNLERNGYFTYTMDMWLTNFCSQEAQWIEIRYDRDGRDIRLRIDLTGGDEK